MQISRVALSIFKGIRGEVSRATNALVNKETVPRVMVTFGNPPNSMTFVSHPGVMAIVKLLEMKSLVSSRARLTQENVDAIAMFDEALSRKCQIALDSKIDINFLELEHIERPEFLEEFLHEKEVLNAARREVLSSPEGTYRIPYTARTWKRPEASRAWRKEAKITKEILEVEPDLVKDLELQHIVTEYLRTKPVDPEVEPEAKDPVVEAATEKSTNSRRTPRTKTEFKK